MPSPVYTTARFLAQLVQYLPVGTNLALAHLLFTMLAGHLLQSRGALFPALDAAKLDPAQVRAAQAALRTGKWSIQSLLARLALLLKRDESSPGKRVVPLRIDGWQVMPIDWVGFYRPQLKNCHTKHFHSQAGRSLKAIELGMVAKLARVVDAPTPASADAPSASEAEASEAKASEAFAHLVALTRSGDTIELLRAAALHKGRESAPTVLLADSQVKITHLHKADVRDFVIRAARHGAFRRAAPRVAPPGARGRKPTLGEVVRPMARVYRGEVIPASEPDRVETFADGRHVVEARWFDSLVVSGCPKVFSCVVVSHGGYRKPWVLLTDVEASGETIFRLYASRWRIESLPQTGKQLLGGHRSYVHGEECRHRLPELSLLCASVSQYLASACPVSPTGFWDREATATAGRHSRGLRGASMPQFDAMEGFCDRIRAKRSVFAHLPRGVEANRRYPGQRAAPRVTGK